MCWKGRPRPGKNGRVLIGVIRFLFLQHRSIFAKDVWRPLVGGVDFVHISGSICPQIPKHRSLAGAESLGDLANLQALDSKCLCPIGLGLRRPTLTSEKRPFLPGHCNPGHLTLTPILKFDFGKTQEQCSYHSTNRTVEFDLLRNDDDPDSLVAPIGQDIHPVLEAAAQAVKLPNDYGFDLAGKDGLLKLLELRSVQSLAALLIDEPTDLVLIVAVGGQPLLDLGDLAVILLTGRADTAICGNHDGDKKL